MFADSALMWPMLVLQESVCETSEFSQIWMLLKYNLKQANLWAWQLFFQTNSSPLFIINNKMQHLSTTSSEIASEQQRSSICEANRAHLTHVVVCVVVVELVLADRWGRRVTVQRHSVPTRRVTRVFTTCRHTQHNTILLDDRIFYSKVTAKRHSSGSDRAPVTYMQISIWYGVPFLQMTPWNWDTERMFKIRSGKSWAEV